MESNALTVVITDSPFPSPQPFLDVLETIDCEVIFADYENTEEFKKLCEKADGMIVTYAEINAEIIEHMKKCKIAARTGVAVNNLDVSKLTEKGIYLTNVVTAQVDDVANHAMTLLLTSVKKIPLLNQHVKGGSWDFNPAVPIHKVNGSTLGLTGFGNIAKNVAKKAQAFGMNVISFDPYVNQEVFDEYHVRNVSFDELLKDSDYISIHMPLTPDTSKMFGSEEFEKMKDSAYIINTARGGIIDELALIQAIKDKKIAGAGLDVIDTEFPGDTHPLYEFPNVIITPHSAYYSEECVEDLQKSAANEVIRVLQGEAPLSLVNKELRR